MPTWQVVQLTLELDHSGTRGRDLCMSDMGRVYRTAHSQNAKHNIKERMLDIMFSSLTLIFFLRQLSHAEGPRGPVMVPLLRRIYKKPGHVTWKNLLEGRRLDIMSSLQLPGSGKSVEPTFARDIFPV